MSTEISTDVLEEMGYEPKEQEVLAALSDKVMDFLYSEAGNEWLEKHWEDAPGEVITGTFRGYGESHEWQERYDYLFGHFLPYIPDSLIHGIHSPIDPLVEEFVDDVTGAVYGRAAQDPKSREALRGHVEWVYWNKLANNFTREDDLDSLVDDLIYDLI